MKHPDAVLYLEHDGKVLLVDSEGNGPQLPQMNRSTDTKFRFPTNDETTKMGINWEKKNTFDILGIQVTKAHPVIEWPEHWAWKDECISDDAVHPIAREAIYRSLHRLVSKVIILNSENKILMGKIERGHFVGNWTLPGGYIDHDESPDIGCVRETLEEMGIEIQLSNDAPFVMQRIFTNEGISFVSFTYRANWLGDDAEIKLKENEIEEFAWYSKEEALSIAVSGFDYSAIKNL